MKNSFFKFVKYLFIVTTISLVIYFTFQSKFDQYLRNILYYYEFGLSIDEDLLPVKSTFSFSYVIYSVVRFVFTPIPTSLIDRLLTGNVTQFGYVDDVVRLVNQTILYLMILYIILKPKYLYVYFKSLINNSKELFLLIFIFTNTLVYSVYYAGGGHSRLKIPIFLGVFLIFNGVVKYNAKKEN